MNTIIYYFTGTGNSLKVSKDLSQYLDNSELIQIRQEGLSHQLFADADTIGFVVPTIFSGIPKLVDQFIKQLEFRKKSPYIFVISTHGDPNGIGIVFEQIEKLLAEKGLCLASCFDIRMPHNVPEKDHLTTNEEKKRLFQEETTKIPIIAESIKRGELIQHKHKKIKSIFERMIYNTTYKSTISNSFDKGFYADEKCINCTTCNKICPAQNIEMRDGKPMWKQHNCQLCFGCLQWCPKEAIQYKKRTVGIERYHHPEIKAKELFYDPMFF
ncbi:iron-sulfur protein [Clostridium zeae]|uniref:Iron-sulfur protein n=1 Tax=Clostridium zeae TaxID=2759022 RepID=A0ABQ1E7V1_9CLOT|nr:EFR1 family ferrodoxin [Clostridium zeae]GFZ30834.1 iron-sulfur protein [Clostridium zeae]